MGKIAAIYDQFSNGMKYAQVGHGEKIILLILGGPGNTIPKGSSFNLYAKPFQPLFESYTIYFITRKSNLPADYTTEDMAKDCAEIIHQDFAGHIHAMQPHLLFLPESLEGYPPPPDYRNCRDSPQSP